MRTVYIAVLLLLSVPPAHASAAAVRQLPSQASPGESISVTLSLDVNESDPPTGVIVKEYLPAGWNVTSSSPQGYFNSSLGVLKWVFYGSGIADTLINYSITVPNNASGNYSFSGVVMTLNSTLTIAGDSQLSVTQGMPDVGINITSPSAGMNYTTLNITLSGAAGAQGNISFSINGGANISVCSNCSTFSINLLNYARFGENTVTIYFTAGSIQGSVSISFSVVCLNDYDLLVYIKRCIDGEFDEQELLQAIDAWARYYWE